jgi:hypothetical protein
MGRNIVIPTFRKKGKDVMEKETEHLLDMKFFPIDSETEITLREAL